MIPWMDSALDSKKHDGFIETKPLIVQIPALNFTITNEYFSQVFYVSAYIIQLTYVWFSVKLCDLIV